MRCSDGESGNTSARYFRFVPALRELLKLMDYTKVIWKYQFDIVDGEQVYEIPLDPSDGILQMNVHVAMQCDKLCLWTTVIPAQRRAKCKFKVVGTGHEFSANYSPTGTFPAYLGSVLSGNFVWHLLLTGIEGRLLRRFRAHTILGG